jgi:hypothetical protein
MVSGSPWHGSMDPTLWSTNNPTRFAREVFASRGFKVRVEKVTRSVSRDASTRGAVDELYAMRSP